MKVLHVVAGNRWTGAAAPAFAEVAALRAEGVDAHYAYVGGYKLEAKIGHRDFTHPIIPKAQNPLSFAAALRSINHLIEHHGFDIIHAHLTYDHIIASLAARGSSARLVRTFHTRRVIRSDPFTRFLIARSSLIFVTNDALRDAALIRDRHALFTPPPLDTSQFLADGDNVRGRYGIADDALLLTAIGKLSKGRGFELVLRTFAAVRAQIERARLMIIGHGDHRPALESLARELHVDAETTWAGYHEDDLADHYRAADFLLFAAKGSDEGHRAVLEAMACGAVPVTIPLEGMGALLGDLSEAVIAGSCTPESLAARVVTLANDRAQLRRRAIDRARKFSFDRAAQRLIAAYSSIL